MLAFECEDKKIWVVPDSLVEKSHILQELASVQATQKEKESPIPLSFPFAAASELMLRYVDDHFTRPCSLENIAKARALADHLGLPIPESLMKIHMLLVLETIRESGVANPFDASACMVLSVDLETMRPDIYTRLPDQSAYEALFWSCVYANANPRQLLADTLGSDGYATVHKCADLLRAKHKRV
jgi:hypothetical protein